MPVVTNLASSLQGLLGGGARFAGRATPREPVMLTSRLRLGSSLSAREDGLTRALDAEGIIVESLGEERYTLLRRQADLLGYTGPTYLETIKMLMNPKVIGYDRPKRIAKRDVLNGSVFFHFTDDNGRNSDVLTLSFQGNTGNIDIIDAAGEEETGGFANLVAWHNLLALADEPMRLADGTKNLIRIDLASRIFRLKLAFFGHFGSNLAFEESASKPNSVDYNFQFVVHRTSPDLYQMAKRLQDATRPLETDEVPGPVDGDVEAGP